MTSDRRPAAERLAQGAVLAIGALLLWLVVDGRSFYLVPGALGLVYLSAALAGGARGGYWATALVLLGFGSAVVVDQRADLGLPADGLEVLGVGVGALTGVLLSRRGVAVDAAGVAATILLIGLVAALRNEVGALTDVATYAVAVGVVGLVNVAVGALRLARDRSARPSAPATR